MISRGRAQLVQNPDKEPLEVYLLPTRKSRHQNFAMTFNAYISDLVLEYQLSGMDFRLMLLMVSQMGYDNVVQETQSELARLLKTKPNVLTRSVSKLVEIQAIRLYKRIGSAKIYQVSPYLATRCNGTAHSRLMEEWNRHIDEEIQAEKLAIRYLESDSGNGVIEEILPAQISKHITKQLSEPVEQAEPPRKSRKKSTARRAV